MNLRAIGLGLVLLVVLAVLPGCPIKTSQGTKLETDVAAMNQRVTTMEKDLLDLQTRFDASGEIAGEAVVGFERLEQELGIVKGQVDEMAHKKPLSPEQISMLRQQLGSQFEAIDGRLATLEKKAGVTKPNKGNLSDFTGNGGATVVAPIPGEDKPKEDDLYREGVALFNQGNLEASKARLKEFMRHYPASKNASEAQYYIAESMFKQRNWEEAILAFDTLAARYPKTKRLPEAYLHMGISFYEAGQTSDAKLFYEKVIEQFPRSREAKVAREKLKAIK
jgi:tol-pal system protein YbgF